MRLVYIGVKQGFVTEFFKLLGAFFSAFITLHYYRFISNLIGGRINLPQGLSDFIAFCFLWGIISLVFMLIRQGFAVLFKVEAHSAFDKWGGGVLGILRAAVICSLAILMIRTLNMDYFNKNLAKSLTAPKVAGFAITIYTMSYDSVISKFFAAEEFNTSALKLREFHSKEK